MTTREVRVLGERFVHEYAGGGRSEAAADLLADDFEAYVPARRTPIRGRAAHVAMNAAWHRALPDFAFVLEAVAADGDQVVVRFRWAATHTGGPLMDVPAGGRRVVVRSEVHWLEAKRGLLVRDHAVLDLGGVVAQLRGEATADES
jgi:predicted ester cyclase